MRHLRHELGLSQNRMVHYLKENGLPPCNGSIEGYYPYNPHFGILEKAMERGEPQDLYINPEADIAPALRKVCSSHV